MPPIATALLSTPTDMKYDVESPLAYTRSPASEPVAGGGLDAGGGGGGGGAGAAGTGVGVDAGGSTGSSGGGLGSSPAAWTSPSGVGDGSALGVGRAVGVRVGELRRTSVAVSMGSICTALALSPPSSPPALTTSTPIVMASTTATATPAPSMGRGTRRGVGERGAECAISVRPGRQGAMKRAHTRETPCPRSRHSKDNILACLSLTLS